MSDPVVEIPEGYVSDMSLNNIKSHLSTLYTYGAKCSSVREIGPSGMFSSGALLYGVLHNANSETPSILADISVSVLEDMANTTNTFSYLETKYPNVDYKWTRTVRPVSPSDQADVYYVPIWHLTDDGTTLFENSKAGTASLSDRIKEYSEYASKYIIIHEKNVLSIGDKMQDPSEPVKEIRCIDPMANHAERLGITDEVIRENIRNTINTFVTENPSWSVVKSDQAGSWVIILEKQA